MLQKLIVQTKMVYQSQTSSTRKKFQKNHTSLLIPQLGNTNFKFQSKSQRRQAQQTGHLQTQQRKLISLKFTLQKIQTQLKSFKLNMTLELFILFCNPVSTTGPKVSTLPKTILLFLELVSLLLLAKMVLHSSLLILKLLV